MNAGLFLVYHSYKYFINVSNLEWNEWINLFYINISICSISNGTCYTWHLHYRRINGDILLHWASYFILDLFTVRKYKWKKQQNQLNTDIFFNEIGNILNTLKCIGVSFNYENQSLDQEWLTMKYFSSGPCLFNLCGNTFSWNVQ